MNIHATYAEHPSSNEVGPRSGKMEEEEGRLSSYFPDRGSFLSLDRFPVSPTAPSSDSYVPTGPFN